MKKIRIVVFASILHDSSSVMNSRDPLFDGLRSLAEIEFIYPSTLASNSPAFNRFIDGGSLSGPASPLAETEECKTVCFIATGGTEEIFRNYLDILPRPVTLISDGLHNSFAASLEIASFLHAQGIRSRNFNAPLDNSPAFYEELGEHLFGKKQGEEMLSRDCPEMEKMPRQTARAMEKKRIGLIGGESSWLISSGIDRNEVAKRTGATFIDIPIRELERAFARVSDSDLEVARICQEKMSLISPDRDEDDLREAAKMYIALKDICTKYTLSALTLKCFDIIGSCHTTACLAMAMLNSEGIVCGCEGDIPALWTMVYANVVYGQPAFMANPASTSRSELTVDLAHCTIPLSMVHGYRLPSHFESRSGIGVAGSVPSGSYRLLKICGSGLDRLYSAEGDIIMNTNIPQRCRTQVRFKFRNERDFNDFLTVCKGNHLVIVKQ